MRSILMMSYVTVMLAGIAQAAMAADARGIMDKAINLEDGDSQYSRQTVATCKYAVKDNRIACTEQPRIKVVEATRKDYGAAKKDQKTVMIIQQPAAEAGIGFLQYDYDEPGKDSDQWMYLSALGKVKRIVSGSDDEPKTGSLFGSEFGYEDIEKRHLDDFNYKILREESYQGQACWVIEAVPTPEHARKSNYSKSESWIDKQRYLTLKVQLYDRRGQLAKQMVQSDFVQQQGVWIARKLNMNNMQSRRISTMKLEHVSLNVPVDDELMTQRTLTDNAFRERSLAQIRASGK